jgi:AcrR family transcriptional regulator
MKRRIIIKAKERFLQFGYSRVRVAEIATELGISKKTVYNHFQGKEELLYGVIEHFQHAIEAELEEVSSQQPMDYREEVLGELAVVGNWVNKLSLLLRDLKRTFPAASDKLWEVQRAVIVERAMKKLDKGVELGFLQADQQTQTALFLFLIAAQKIADPDYRDTIPPKLLAQLPNDPKELLQRILMLISQGISLNKEKNS